MVPATRVQEIADEVLGEHLVADGFRRGRGRRAGWTSDVGEHPRFVALGFSKWNGVGVVGEFRVEVGAGRSHLPGAVPSLPLSLLLDDVGRAEARDLHDTVMRMARKAAPNADPSLYVPRDRPFPRGVEFFFPYADEDDLRAWFQFVIRHLPAAMDRLLADVRKAWGDPQDG